MKRYREFSALARAAELVGERWTLLIVRELLLGPKRFADLRRGLTGISPAVLTERLQRMERARLVRRSELPPPAAVSVYELTGDGSALRPALMELVSWGGRFLFPRRPGEALGPQWMRVVLEACARRGPTPDRSFLLQLRRGTKSTDLHVAGGPQGTRVSGEIGPVDATVTAPVETIFALVSGASTTDTAVAQQNVQVTGDLGALRDLPLLFHMGQLFDLGQAGPATPERPGGSNGRAGAPRGPRRLIRRIER